MPSYAPAACVSTKGITTMIEQTGLAFCLDKDECVSRREQVSVLVFAKKEARGCGVQTSKFGLPKWETASITPLCEIVQYVPHPACDGRIFLGLGDQVAQQGVGAEEVQANVGGLCEVSQHW